MSLPPEHPLPNPNAPKPTELAWRGETILVVREGRWWTILRGRRRLSGPAYIPGERSSTQDRIREWLDLDAGPERLA